MRPRTLAALVLAGAFLGWNAIFDHVLVVAGDLYVVLAPALAQHGLHASLDDWMGPAKAFAFWSASAIIAAALAGAAASAGLAAIARSRMREARRFAGGDAPTISRP